MMRQCASRLGMVGGHFELICLVDACIEFDLKPLFRTGSNVFFCITYTSNVHVSSSRNSSIDTSTVIDRMLRNEGFIYIIFGQYLYKY